ncbi:hypothetical protein SAMN04489722_106231 [Algibacter lectus]|uniref:hypothetical protein n=1 Tax=Algibacter lectus TaxID=221126 RepID=UPI0008E88ED3|nr:hypothetical protein [Algibacter lectus]SFD25328.1 hypothetical protein SAMN04489722_106231 [Algibacter lectus]
MFSIAIRNKYEANHLEKVLSNLKQMYSIDFDGFIIVDNKSTDNSFVIVNVYSCNICAPDLLFYVKLINLLIAQQIILKAVYVIKNNAVNFKGVTSLNSVKKHLLNKTIN